MAPEHGRFTASSSVRAGSTPVTHLGRSAPARGFVRVAFSALALVAQLMAPTARRSLAEPASSATSATPTNAHAARSDSSAGASSAQMGSSAAASVPATTPAADPESAPPVTPQAHNAPAPGLDETPTAPLPDAAAHPSVAPVATPTRTAAARGAAGPEPSHSPGAGRADQATATAASATAGTGTAFTPPANLDDVGAWLEYRAHNHIGSLPQESRIFYRRGLQLYNTGSFEEAVRLVRGACELDADYVAPHLTLASWFLLRDPSQALLQIAAALDLARQNFVLQLSMLANLLVVLLQSLFLGLLAAALLLVFLHNAELRHTIQERLGSFVELRGARVWAWGLVVLPFLAGVGVALPAIVMLGLLWSTLRIRERLVLIALTVMIAAAPLAAGAIDRLSLPLRPEQGPFYGIPDLPAETYSPDRQQQITTLADQNPNDGFAQFALGWLARRGGDLQLAERAYRHALQIWPHDDRVMNDLGNSLAMQGRPDEALVMYQQAYAANSHNAAAYFNASQIFTQRFEYKAANEALSRASALNFDLVKAYQAQATEDGLLPLVDQWLAPRTFWNAMPALHASEPGAAVLPPGWRSRWECSGWVFSVLIVVLAIGSVMLGRRLHGEMPLRTCSNCGCVVCRRCAERRREIALCATCGAVENRAESAEFARVLLMQRRRGVARRWRMLRTALATLIPGFGMLALGRLFMPILLLSSAAALCAPWIGLRPPFGFEPRLLETARDASMWAGIAAWLLLYAISLLGYIAASAREQHRPATPEVELRPRSGDPPKRVTAAAA
jgi:tetratricopeptide (TPR) repeat protein